MNTNVKYRYMKRLTMLLLESVGPEVRLVDREAVRELVKEAKKRGASDKDLEMCHIQITYELIPYGQLGPRGMDEC